MKKFMLFACVVAIAIVLSSIPSDAGVYRSKSKASCSGVSKVREYARGRSATCSGGVSRARSIIRAKRNCAG